MQHWTGTLAHTGRPSNTGTTLAAPERLLTRPLPLPLIENNAGGPLIGAITAVSIHADEIRAEGTIREGILTPGQPAPVGIDIRIEDADPQPDNVHIRRWRIVAAYVLTDTRRAPAWPGVAIRLKEGPK